MPDLGPVAGSPGPALARSRKAFPTFQLSPSEFPQHCRQSRSRRLAHKAAARDGPAATEAPGGRCPRAASRRDTLMPVALPAAPPPAQMPVCSVCPLSLSLALSLSLKVSPLSLYLSLSLSCQCLSFLLFFSFSLFLSLSIFCLSPPVSLTLSRALSLANSFFLSGVKREIRFFAASLAPALLNLNPPPAPNPAHGTPCPPLGR